MVAVGREKKLCVVTRVERKYRDYDTDEWMCSAVVRPATDEEAAPILARRARHAARDARLSELAAIITPACATDEEYPAGAQSLVAAIGDVRGMIHASTAGHRDYLLAPDGAVWRSVSGYDDAPQLWRTESPRAAELMLELMAESGRDNR